MEDSSSKLFVIGIEDDKCIFFALVPKKLYVKMFMSQTRISQPFPTPIANKK